MEKPFEAVQLSLFDMSCEPNNVLPFKKPTKRPKRDQGQVMPPASLEGFISLCQMNDNKLAAAQNTIFEQASELAVAYRRLNAIGKDHFDCLTLLNKVCNTLAHAAYHEHAALFAEIHNQIAESIALYANFSQQSDQVALCHSGQ